MEFLASDICYFVPCLRHYLLLCSFAMFEHYHMHIQFDFKTNQPMICLFN